VRWCASSPKSATARPYHVAAVPYKTHPAFTPPSDPTVGLWRYVTFEKFVALLQTRALWFSRADLLEDRFEGSYTVPATERLRRMFPNVPQLAVRIGPNFEKVMRAMPKFHHINCWHINDQESAAMWAIYAGLGKGVAIRSTFSRLIRSLQGKDEIYVGVVNYIDYKDRLDSS
jgi:hypothetical protein